MPSDQVLVNVAQAVFILRGTRNVLHKLQKRVGCKFTVHQIGWNQYNVIITGTELGIKKGRSLLLEQLEYHFNTERRNRAKSTDKFGFFGKLPFEIKQMIVDRVPCEMPGRSKYDGTGLMNLRAASKELKKYAECILKRDRKCLKDSLYFSETYNSNHVRLGTPPFQSLMVVKTEDFDHLLERISLVGKKEVHIRCEFRKSWCDSMMGLLMKNKHIKPTVLKIYGVTGDLSLFHDYIAQTPSLQYLIFEKSPDGGKLLAEKFMPLSSKHFYNLGPQDRMPENIRNSYNSRIIFTREHISEDIDLITESNELKF